MLSEINQTAKDKYCTLSLKHKQTNVTKEKQIHRYKTKLAVTSGEMEGVKGKGLRGTNYYV